MLYQPPMPQASRLTALRLLDPTRFRSELEWALVATRGNVTRAAERLRTSHRTLRRLLASEPNIDRFASDLRRGWIRPEDCLDTKPL